MKILFVANRVPYPPFRGDKLKIYNLAKRLSKTHELHLITFAESKEDFSYLPELTSIFTKINIVNLPKWRAFLHCFFALFSNLPFQVAYFKSKRMKNLVKDFIDKNEIQIIHTQHLRMAQFTSGITLPKILDLPDAFSLYWQRRIGNQQNPALRILEKIEFARLYRYEREIIKHFTLNLVCSVEDLKYMQTQHSASSINLLRNGVDLSTFNSNGHNYAIKDTILFTGNMDYAPNIDAVVYFAKQIFPVILKNVPDVKFIIAGQRPVKSVLDLKSNHIEVTGFIPELKTMYQKASIVVSPLRIGAGTQNKVLEAMAMGIPVVSGTIGFEGLEIKSGDGVFLETNAEGFASKIIELLNSESERESCGLIGQKLSREKFSWDTIASQLDAYCQSIGK